MNQEQNEETNYQSKVEKKHNILYKTTNLINGKFYFGIHSTNNLEDGYLGSGKLIQEAIKKYGKENFAKIVIADYPTRKEASNYEARIVTMDLVEDENCYNIRTGGDNEFTFEGMPRTDEFKMKTSIRVSGKGNPMFGKSPSIEHRQRIREKALGRKPSEQTRRLLSARQLGEKNHNFGKPVSEKTRKLISETKVGDKNPMFGKTHTDEAIQKMKQQAIGRKHSNETKQLISKSSSGENNGMFGNHHTDITKIKIKETNIGLYLIEGKHYLGIDQIIVNFQLKPNQIYSRIRSKSKKWNNWIKLKLEDYL